PHGEPPRRWAQSRPDANGRGVQHRQPRPAGLDRGLAYPGRDLCPLRRLINQQQREPLAAVFGGGSASSSDGQFFRAGGFGREASSINAHYGDEPGVKFYTHLSDRYAPFHTKVIAATASEA